MAHGSNLSADAFPGKEFDFMLSNPPYGKSWKTDLERLGGKKGIRDPRFAIKHGGDPEYSLITRSSDGQMLFLANMLSKMKSSSRLGSRIAEVHNGSSLFTGDAGSGESNIRRWIVENDWLEAIVALPPNIFYNTGIATYIWILSNRKASKRRGKVQLIDATDRFRPLRKSLGKKTCELESSDIERVCKAFLDLEESDWSKLFPNEAFGYSKITVERPLRLRVDLDDSSLRRFRTICHEASEAALASVIDDIAKKYGAGPHRDFNRFLQVVEAEAAERSVRMTAKRRKLFEVSLGTKDPEAKPVILKVSRIEKEDKRDALHGRYCVDTSGKAVVVEYEADPDLRDTEQVPLLEDGGIEGFFRREVLPYAPDAWIDASKTAIGYEISFTRHFYKPKPLRTLKEIETDIRALEKETEGFLDDLLVGGD